LQDGEVVPWDHRDNLIHSQRIGLLAKYIWEAISEVVVKSREAMQWLSKVAREYSKEVNKRADLVDYDKRMTWFTPDGFEVVHYMEAFKTYRVETILDGRLRTQTYVGEGKLDPKDMALAVAPNFVHALDATHLRMTINKALGFGITSFAMVHDSFGVHAGKMATFLQHCVKPAFVELYQHDVLQEFADRFKDICSEVPPIPTKGTLELEGVLKSEFFFS
jgi:DNA-directed RNA polymerase